MGIDISKIVNATTNEKVKNLVSTWNKNQNSILEDDEQTGFLRELGQLSLKGEVSEEEFQSIMGLCVEPENDSNISNQPRVSTNKADREMISERMVTLFAEKMQAKNVGSFSAVTDDVIKELKDSYKSTESRVQVVENAESVINKTKALWNEVDPKNKEAVEKLESDLKSYFNQSGVSYTYQYKMLVNKMVAVVKAEVQANEQKEIANMGKELLEGKDKSKYEIKGSELKNYDKLFEDLEVKLKADGKWKSSYYQEAFKEYKKTNFNQEINASYDKIVKDDKESKTARQVRSKALSTPAAQASDTVSDAYKSNGDNKIKRQIIARKNVVGERRAELANVEQDFYRNGKPARYKIESAFTKKATVAGLKMKQGNKATELFAKIQEYLNRDWDYVLEDDGTLKADYVEDPNGEYIKKDNQYVNIKYLSEEDKKAIDANVKKYNRQEVKVEKNKNNMQMISDFIRLFVGPDFVLNGGKDGRVIEPDNLRELNHVLGLNPDESNALTEDDVKILAEYCGYEVRDKEYGGAKDIPDLIKRAVLAGLPAFVTTYIGADEANKLLEDAIKRVASITYDDVYGGAQASNTIVIDVVGDIISNMEINVNGETIESSELARLFDGSKTQIMWTVTNNLDDVPDKETCVKRALEQVYKGAQIPEAKMAAIAAAISSAWAIAEFAVEKFVIGSDILYEEAVQNEALRYISSSNNDTFEDFAAYQKFLNDKYGAGAQSIIEIARHFVRDSKSSQPGTINTELYHDWLNKASGLGSKMNKEELVGALLLQDFPSQEEVNKTPCDDSKKTVVDPPEDPVNPAGDPAVNPAGDPAWQHWTTKETDENNKPENDTLTVKRKDVKTWEFIIKKYYPGLIKKCGSYSAAVKALKMALACGDEAEYQKLRRETDLRKEIKLPHEVAGIQRVDGGKNPDAVTNTKNPKRVTPTNPVAGCDCVHSTTVVGGQIIHHYKDKNDSTKVVHCSQAEVTANPNIGKEKLAALTGKKYPNPPEEI